MLDNKHQKIITLTKLDDTSHYRLWRAATEATFDVYNVLNIALGPEVKSTEISTSDASDSVDLLSKIIDWECGHLKVECLKK